MAGKLYALLEKFSAQKNIQKIFPSGKVYGIGTFLKKKSHTIHYGFIMNDDGSVLDEVMVLLMKSPKSYTCEDVVEIDSHGGISDSKNIEVINSSRC